MSEFVREVRLDTIGDAPRTLTLEATPAERAALAVRFGLLSVDGLNAHAELRGDGGGTVLVEGGVAAAVTQACVATGVPVGGTISETFALRFVPEKVLDDAAGEVELAADELDTVGYAGGAIDLGEAVAETLGLAIDPFPRAPGADAALAAAGVLRPEDTGPFAALRGLRDRLEE